MPRYFQLPRSDADQLLVSGRGLVSENYPAGDAVGASIGVTQTLYAGLIGLRSGDVVTSVTICSSTAAASLTLAKVGLYSTAGVQLASSATNHGAYNGATGYISTALSSAYTAPTSGVVYAVILQVGTTPTTFTRGYAINATAWGAIGSNPAIFAHQTGQADLPAPATLVTNASTLPIWFGVI